MRLVMKYNIGFQIWKNERWHRPRWFNNLYRELDFGKFSIFLGRGKHRTAGVITYVPPRRCMN